MVVDSTGVSSIKIDLRRSAAVFNGGVIMLTDSTSKTVAGVSTPLV